VVQVEVGEGARRKKKHIIIQFLSSDQVKNGYSSSVSLGPDVDIDRSSASSMKCSVCGQDYRSITLKWNVVGIPMKSHTKV